MSSRPILMDCDAAMIDHATMQAFKQRNHSLRVSVSNLAALIGLHPYKDVPELVLSLVYQGSVGRALLRHDAALLGMVLTTPEEQLQQLARKAGSTTQNALQTAMRVTSDTVDAARSIKQAVLTEAKQSGQLQGAEVKLLEEGVRSIVDTRHGTAHEDEALNEYERLTGWAVRERNAEVKSMAFTLSCENEVPTLSPIGEAVSLYRNTNESLENKSSRECGSRADQKSDTRHPQQTGLDEEPQQTNAIVVSERYAFLYLLGSIDGLRDELAPTDCMQTDNDGDSGWVLRSIVVECKHRMSRLYKDPPIYEQIQTIAYCFMYGTEHADILQVMRQQEEAPKKIDTMAAVSTTTENSSHVTTGKISSPVIDKFADASDGESRNLNQRTGRMDTLTTESVGVKTEAHVQTLTVSITRVALDDPVHRHRTQWNRVVLPRLRSIVEAIYRIRSDDLKRYQLLSFMSMNSSGIGSTMTAWSLIFDECPWLKHCETAFTRRPSERS